MTFTQYLRHLVAMGLAPSFWRLLDSGEWPDSLRLEAYEELLYRHIEDACDLVLLELRTLWSRWAAGPASSANLSADLSLLAWRDYAVHLRTCELLDEGPCPRAVVLLARAVQESHFGNLAELPADPVPCEDPDDAEARREAARVADQVLGLPGVEEVLGHHPSHRRHSTLKH